jgi:(p)ppGpp synthase/HD superfamily hydrolase
MTRLTQRFQEALNLATKVHAGQYRKGKDVPYIAHLLAVTALVLENGGDEDEAIAALLHDTIEDQRDKISLQEIRQQFGDKVAGTVDGLTDAKTWPKRPWRQRKEAYIAHLRQSSPSERLVSAADKLHNARSLLYDYRTTGESIWQRFNGGKEGTLWYYRALLEAFRAAGPTPLVDELERVISELERLVASTSGRRTGTNR